MSLRDDIEQLALDFEMDADMTNHQADAAYRNAAQRLRRLLDENPEPTTGMVRIEGAQLIQLQNMISPARTTPVTLLRVDQRGDSVAFKADGGCWTPGYGRPQEAY